MHRLQWSRQGQLATTAATGHCSAPCWLPCCCPARHLAATTATAPCWNLRLLSNCIAANVRMLSRMPFLLHLPRPPQAARHAGRAVGGAPGAAHEHRCDLIHPFCAEVCLLLLSRQPGPWHESVHARHTESCLAAVWRQAARCPLTFQPARRHMPACHRTPAAVRLCHTLDLTLLCSQHLPLCELH